MRRGGKLAMDIDRYARLLTEMEEYERAKAIFSRALLIFFEGRWLPAVRVNQMVCERAARRPRSFSLTANSRITCSGPVRSCGSPAPS
jgi:hypothetical protein